MPVRRSGTTPVRPTATRARGTTPVWRCLTVGASRKGAGRYPQGVALLARLGVSIDHEGKGIGAALLDDVVSRTAQIGASIGCRGLLVHAESEAAQSFYLHLITQFEPSLTDPLHLVLLMKHIRRTLGS